MRLIAKRGDADMLQRLGHLRRGHVAELGEGFHEAGIAGAEATTQPRQAGALRQRVERHHMGVVAAGDFQNAGRRFVAEPDFRIAFVGEDHHLMRLGEGDEAFEIGARRDDTLRVGRRGEIDGNRTVEQGAVERVEIRQEIPASRQRQVDALAAGGVGAGAIGGIERIGKQDRRCLSAQQGLLAR